MKHVSLHFNSLILIIFMLLFSSVFLVGCASKLEPKVELIQEQDSILQEASASGEVIPKKWAVLSFPNGGNNLALNVEEGESVVYNQVLVTSSDQRLLSQLFQTEAAMKRTQNNYDLMKESPTELALANARATLANAEAYLDQLNRANAAKAQIDAAEADVERARIQLEDTQKGASEDEIAAALADLKAAEYAYVSAQAAFSLRAPFAGEIVAIHVNQKESVPAFQPVILLADLSEFEVITTDLSEVDVRLLAVGQKVNIVFDAIPNQSFKGTIDRIALKSSGGSAVYYDVFISMDEPPTGLRWGMTAFITIPNK